jgi:hypothetical protein
MNKFTKIGLMLQNLNASQKAYMFIQQLNSLVSNNTNVDACVFFNEVSLPCVKPMFSVSPALELWGFHQGLVITTDIDTTLMAIKTCTSSKVIHYIDDLEWTRKNKQDFLYNLPAYRSQMVELITPSVSYAKLVENYCNRKVSAVIPGYDLNEILKRFTNANANIRF